MRHLCFISTLLAAAALVRNAAGQEQDSFTAAAKELHRSTVTLRIKCTLKEGDEAAERSPPKSTGNEPQRREGRREPTVKASKGPCSVVVCSAVCVADKKVITAIPVSSDSKIRLTFPDGTQDDARLRVIDQFSGLVLLDSPKCAATPLALADKLPEEGSPVVTAAAWGVEKPLVFQGMVSGTAHLLSGVCYPPLLVCQLPTTPTSTGSAIVTREGKLVGIIVGADPNAAERGLITYAVPVSHVKRLLRACEESDKKGNTESVVVLKRRRPVVGWALENEGDVVVVQRVFKGDPAEKAGIRVGDQVLAVNGVKIRSIYQALHPTLCKQPGDTLTFQIRRGGEIRDVTLVLGGGIEMNSLPAEKLSDIIQPKLEFVRDDQGGYYSKSYRRSAEDESDPQAARISALKRKIESYEQVIEAQQEQLKQREGDRARHEELIQSLQAEVDRLRKQLDAVGDASR